MATHSVCLAISGFNITIIAGIFRALAERLVGKRRSMPVVLAGIAVYTFLVGADTPPSSVRPLWAASTSSPCTTAARPKP